MNLEFDENDLRRLVAPIVEETIRQLEADLARLNGQRIGYPEPEAAALLGVPRHTLRDARLRGEVVGAKVGNKVVYEATELHAFLARQRLE